MHGARFVYVGRNRVYNTTNGRCDPSPTEGHSVPERLPMETDVASERSELETRWRLREQEWARKLGRLHLGVEPIEEQLARYRRATWGLTIVPGLIALAFLTLFTVFGRPDIGLVVIGILSVPIIMFSWVDYLRLKRRARAYLAERANFVAREDTASLNAKAETSTTS